MTALAGKVAVVTGSTSGIGLGIARGLAVAGASVVTNGFGDAKLVDGLVGELREAGAPDAFHHPADMARPEEISSLIEQTVTRHRRLDILVDNAGIQHVAPVEHFPPERWDAVIAINLSAPFHAIRAALPQMRRTGWGRIVNIASAHGLVASREKSAYVAAKHGVVGLTKVAALDYAAQGIRINAIAPGPILTDRLQAAGEQAQRGGTAMPMRRIGLPAEVAAAAVWLCSDQAAFITGETLVIDGGKLAGTPPFSGPGVTPSRSRP